MTTESTTVESEVAAEEVGRLMAEHGDRVYGLGLRFCGNSADAEDLAQETFLQAYRKWDQFEGRAAPTTWLYTIASRLCQRRRRRRSGEPEHLESLSDLGTEGRPPEPAAALDDPLDRRHRQEMLDRLDQALGHLPAKFRLPLVLKDITELSVAEVAAVLGLKEATVKTRIHRARLALQQQLLAGAPDRPSSPETHGGGVCLDLLAAKQEALDRGKEFPVASEELCTRCRTLFSSLDLTADFCHRMSGEHLPPAVRRKLAERMS